MEFILDFQGFKNENNEFVVKELAIVSTNGLIYELQLFLPPCDLNQLPQNVQKQVHWLETHLHGLYWAAGFKEYSQLKDVFKNIDISGTVYVKGEEKKIFIAQLLSNFKVNVVNLEDHGCPSLQLLKQTIQMRDLKPCLFNHPTSNCAYLNAHILLQWWNMEKIIFAKRVGKINEAIKEWVTMGYKMRGDLIKYLPKEFIVNCIGSIEPIYHKLPQHLKTDVDVVKNMPCLEHYQAFENGDVIDGPVPKRKHCYYCRKMITLDN